MNFMDELLKYFKKTDDEIEPLRDEEQVEWATPTKLFSHKPLLPVPQLTEDMLPDAFQRYVFDSAKGFNHSPPEFVAISVMISAAALIGTTAKVQPKRKTSNWQLAPNLWGGNVAYPSTMKSPSLKAGVKLLEKAQRTVIDEANVEIIKTNQMLLSKDNNFIPSVFPREVIINDFTLEALGVRMKQNPIGVAMVRDEISGFISDLQRQDKMNERAFMLEAFNGDGRFVQERIGRGKTVIDPVICSIVGNIQPDRISPLLKSRDNGLDDGVFERFQLLVFPDIPEGGYIDYQPSDEVITNVETIFFILAKMGESPITKPFMFDNEAQKIWDDWSIGFSEKVRHARVSHQNVLNKYPALCAKLALLFHIIEEATDLNMDDEFNPAPLIPVKFLHLAFKWLNFLEKHNQRIVSFAKSTNELDPARYLLDRLPQLDSPFKKRTLARKNWKGLTTYESCQEALSKLETLGYLRKRQQTDNNNRTSVVYHIHPDYM